MRASRLIIGLSALLAAATALSAPARAGDAQDLAQAWNRTGVELFARLSEKPGNLVISPVSAGEAMAMVQEGAAGETAKEMAKVLHLGEGGKLATATPELEAMIRQSAEDGEAELGLASAMHLTQNGELVRKEYRERIGELFGAEITAGSDLKQVNDWVKDKTGGQIDKILDRLDPRSVGVLLSAIHMQAKWEKPFDPKRTVLAPFQLDSGESPKTRMMRGVESLKAMADEKVAALSIPYAGNGLALAIVLPSDPATPLSAIDPASLPGILDKLAEAEARKISVQIPKFSMNFEADLIEPFQSLGMKLPFEDVAADFSRMAESGGANTIYISQIRQKAKIEVDEQGTKAAAVTAVEMSIRSIALPKIFVVDRPFIFAVTEARSGAILFLGRVSDPRPAR